MAAFILAGFQRSLARQVRKALQNGASKFEGWSAQPFVGHKNDQNDIGLCQIEDLLKMAQEHHDAHIFGLSTLNNRHQAAERIRPFFRFRWLDDKPVRLVGTGDESTLIDTLRGVIDEESYWLTNVKPKDSASPLVLPEIFSCRKDLREIWRLSESYGNRGHFEQAVRLIVKFKDYHRHKIDKFENKPWLAEDDWIWNDDGERHGTSSFPHNWKYSLKLPDGFHFDVSAKRKGKTHFSDRRNQSHPYKTHLNVSAHGDVRGTEKRA